MPSTTSEGKVGWDWGICPRLLAHIPQIWRLMALGEGSGPGNGKGEQEVTAMEERYNAYADLALDVGLNLQSGQRLWLSMPITAAPLARVIARAAYHRGARYVEMNWTDDEMTLARFEHAPRDSFTEFSVWRSEAMLAGAKEGDAFLSVRASDPQLLKDQDPGLVTTMQRTGAEHNKEYLTYVTGHKVNWCVLAVPIPACSP